MVDQGHEGLEVKWPQPEWLILKKMSGADKDKAKKLKGKLIKKGAGKGKS